MAMIRVQTFFPIPLIQKIDVKAKERGVSRSEVVRQILERYFMGTKKETRG